MPLLPKFKQFQKERQYLKNVSPRTVEWYGESLAWLGVENPTQNDLKDFVLRMRAKGLKPTSCNNRIRAVNAYLHWASECGDEKCGPRCPHLKVPSLKEEKRILPTFNVKDVRVLAQWKAKTWTQRRLKVLMLTLGDAGCRISEALAMDWPDVDFDNLLLTLHGKGGIDRKVPFSMELRRHLFRLHAEKKCNIVFSTRTLGRLDRRVVLRDVKRQCRKLGVVVPERTLHSFRHTFAIHYLRNGGSTFHLQKALGHADLAMTRKYANLLVDDLQKVHERVSLLSAARGK
jgi:integrase/recombinase XerD